MSFCGPPGQDQNQTNDQELQTWHQWSDEWILYQVTMGSGRNEISDTHYENMYSNIKLVSFLETNTIELKNVRMG